jgi:hypothetical protein
VAALACSSEPESKAKLRRRATAVSLHARGISIAHVPRATEQVVSTGHRGPVALVISSVVNSRAVVPINKGRLKAGSSTRTTSRRGCGVSRTANALQVL